MRRSRQRSPRPRIQLCRGGSAERGRGSFSHSNGSAYARLTLLRQMAFDELHDSLTHIEAVPGFLRRKSLHAPGKRAVPFARVLHHLDMHTFLAQRAIHLLALTQRIRDVAVALNQQERCLDVARIRERALPPSVREVDPGLAIPPAVVP